MKKVYIILQNGHVFEGRSFGTDGRVVGEITFSTSMVGYIESLTDPSSYGQILVSTFPLIGNYGINKFDMQSDKIHAKALVVRECCEDPSNYRSEGRLDAWLKENNIVGVCGVDTRAITKILREYGNMNAVITDTLPDPIVPDDLLTYETENPVFEISTKEKKVYKAENEKYNVALLDLGVRKDTIDSLLNLGCSVTVFPASTQANEILNGSFDGLVLSEGPGDPRDNIKITLEIRKLFSSMPILGIGLGHQLLAASQGAITRRLKYGHRGSNQPVLDKLTGRVYITSQNHGYTVSHATLPTYAKIRYANKNDNTIEGIDYEGKHAISCQFHPEATSRSKDNRVMYDRFISVMENFKNGEDK